MDNMPNRTPEAKQLIDSLPVKTSDKLCNARTPTGYCRMPAGFNTDHLHEGRCYLHGGRAGRSITHGLYSEKLKSTLKVEYDKMVNDPALVDIYAELAVAKTMMGKFIETLAERIESSENIFVAEDRFGTPIVSPEAKVLVSLLETLSRLFVRITDAETKSSNTLNIKQVYAIVKQIKNAMNDSCGDCPIRLSVGEKLKDIRTPILGDGA